MALRTPQFHARPARTTWRRPFANLEPGTPFAVRKSSRALYAKLDATRAQHIDRGYIIHVPAKMQVYAYASDHPATVALQGLIANSTTRLDP